MHIPVLQKEALEYLNPQPNENFIDCTFGGGGHGLAILEKILPYGKLLAIDWDKEIIHQSKAKNNLTLVCDNFANLKNIVERKKFKQISGIIFDLGMSSWHIEKSGRGFSFLRDESLDMRFQNSELRAEEIINTWSEKEIERILKEYGEERFSKRITNEIIKERKLKSIKTTFQLREIIKQAVPKWYQHQRIHFATKTFQALRIAVNNELENLKIVLHQALDILEPEGRLVVISFHSLEDGIVKHFFKNNKYRLQILTKKPITASEEEIKMNPRSRSAKLRAIIKTCA